MAVVALVGPGTVIGGTASFAGPATSTPSGTPTAAMRVIELQGPGGSFAFPRAMNNHGTIVGYAGPGLQAARWNRYGQATRMPGLGAPTEALDVNDRGTAIGYTTTPSEQQLPALWDATGRLTVLPSLPDHRVTEVRSINDHGIAVGAAYAGDFHNHPYRPVLWDRNHRITVLPMPPGYRYGEADLVSEDGTIVGRVAKELGWDKRLVPARWDRSGNPHLLNTLGLLVNGVASINSHGVSVGSGAPPYSSLYRVPLRWDRYGRVSRLPLPPEAQGTFITRINDRGVAIGSTLVSGSGVALRWDRDGNFHPLSRLSGSQYVTPDAINDRGVIVGTANMGNDSFKAVMWGGDGAVKALPTPAGYWFASARLVNNRGMIIGWGSTGPVELEQAFLWLPV
jgi:uncharacterized membrane protein